MIKDLYELQQIEELVERIDKLRVEHNYSIYELAVGSGLSVNTITRFRLTAKSSLVSSLFLFPQSLIDFAGALIISLQRSALGLDASIFNASACHRLRYGCAAPSES